MKLMEWLVGEVPQLEGRKTKLVRHTTKEEGLARYIARSVENLEEWQKVQRNPVFHDCEFKGSKCKCFLAASTTAQRQVAAMVAEYADKPRMPSRFAVKFRVAKGHNGIASPKTSTVVWRRFVVFRRVLFSLYACILPDMFDDVACKVMLVIHQLVSHKHNFARFFQVKAVVSFQQFKKVHCLFPPCFGMCG